jgi:hypothetical protein
MSTSRTIAFLTLVGALTTGAYAQYNVSVFAGGGPPNGSAATSIAISYPWGSAVDSSGNVYVPAGAQNRVYKVATNGTSIIRRPWRWTRLEIYTSPTAITIASARFRAA